MGWARPFFSQEIKSPYLGTVTKSLSFHLASPNGKLFSTTYCPFLSALFLTSSLGHLKDTSFQENTTFNSARAVVLATHRPVNATAKTANFIFGFLIRYHSFDVRVPICYSTTITSTCGFFGRTDFHSVVIVVIMFYLISYDRPPTVYGNEPWCENWSTIEISVYNVKWFLMRSYYNINVYTLIVFFLNRIKILIKLIYVNMEKYCLYIKIIHFF